MRTSQTSAVIASTTMELIGQTSVTTPAITVRILMNTYQPRSGSAGTSIANAVAVTPWNMKSNADPSGQHPHGGAVVEVAEGEVAQHD